MKYRNLAYVLGGILFLGLFFYLAWSSGWFSKANSTTTATSTVTFGEGFSLTTSGKVAVKESGESVTPVDFRLPLLFKTALEANVQQALSKQYDATVAVLASKPTDFQAWINLGLLRKLSGDYEGAVRDWSYVAKLYPKSTVPFDNLGWLYLDFIKDYPKAEANFKQAIANDKHDITAYQQLFSLYTIYGYKKGTSAAADLIRDGLKANPNNEILLQLQAQLSGS
jgi:tetratricopeptide (TPR) repeat protein